MKQSLKIFRGEKGFALIEIAIALIVMGLVLGAGIPSFLHYLKWQKIQETKEKQEKILYSLAGFVLQNGFVPLPAAPYEKGENFGLSRKSLNTPLDMRGLIPFKTLGLPESYSKDGFKRYFTYIGGGVQKEGGNLSAHSSFCQTHPVYPLKVDERQPSGSLSKRSDALASKSPVVLILMSHGESGYGSYRRSEGNIKQALKSHRKSLDKQQNASQDLRVVNRGPSVKPQDFFDDIIVWVTRENLMAFYGKRPCYQQEETREEGIGHVVI
ncbi:type II secretion system GspH family protein [Alphaproteobacteria bacterium]|nr:type II secretion system GspH family protein [Alphaproteobacteria bacterium]